MNDEQWIEQMRQKMADYKRPAPEVSWDELDRALAAGKVRKTRLLWLRRMAAAVAVFLIAGVGYWGFLQNHSDENHGVRSENHGDWHNDRSAAEIRVPVPVILDSVPNKNHIPAILASSAQKPTMTIALENHGDWHNDSSEAEIRVPVPVISVPEISEEKEQPHTTEKKAKPADYIPPVIYPSDLRQRKQSDNRLTAKAYISSTMNDRLKIYNSLQGNIKEIKDTTHIKQHINHHQPVRFGLSMRYRLDNRWSLESGLTYTRLSSDITTTVDGVTTMTEQRLKYIGLPLNISYDLWKSRHFGLYVTAGSTIEKCLDTSSWQFSINGSAGAEYKLTDVFSLYAEPGLGYYFKDGSTTPTIYQDRPLNFNLSIGLRFNLK